MSTSSRLAGALLFTTALTFPALAHAQDEGAANDTATTSDNDGQHQDAEDVDISVPGGGEIIVTGRANRNVEESSTQVVSVLSAAEIARTGEGDIAGALSRVTGLSVVGNGFVYVRGLGDRYSLALLNGSPLPSPEPLKRVVPLDLFPTGLLSSSLVQKSYSANYPGEFGGGVINLTTKAVPRDAFLTVSVGASGDSITTFHTGLTYYGSSSDWTGYDNGNRDTPPALQAFFDSGDRLSSGTVQSAQIAREIVTGRNSVVQTWNDIPANFSGSISAGKSWPLGDGDFGVIATAGYSSKWKTTQPHQQTSLSADLSTIESDFTTTKTDQRVVVNGLFGLGYEFSENSVRWTNLYIHDTIKQSRIGIGQRPSQNNLADFFRQGTGWYERQLFDSQIVGEFELTDRLSLDVRGGYANSKRKAPFELTFEYVRTNSPADPFGAYFVNRLNNGNGGNGSVTFSDLNEDLWSGGVDLTYELFPELKVTAGAAYSDTHRSVSRRDFLFLAPNQFMGSSEVISAIGMLRPDRLVNALSAPTFLMYSNGLQMIETDEGNPAFAADLTTWAGYGKGTWQIADALSLDLGVRYENGDQMVSPIQVFTTPGSGTVVTGLKKDYWLPAATLTYEIEPGMQVRLNASKTIARPQFRELINQPYFDPETSRPYRGNPLLGDSQLYNAEARFEYYFARDERVSVAGFYKKIDNPIEAFIVGVDLTTSYANAPEATLYGAELDLQKYFDLGDFVGDGMRRLLVGANYTYTQSKLKVGPNDTVTYFGAASTIASDYFQDGLPLTGQSDHLVNLQVGLENDGRLSQQTFLVSYASERVVSRGLNGTIPQPDIIERPGVQLDFVWREGFNLLGVDLEAEAEVRNILGTDHEEYQQSGSNRLDVNTYKEGTTYGLSISANF
ncbi:TonB-dependent receptor [Altererythrobacter salegens]|uniref:TonB-dependent receptor n=1 Tax=Croceibacterium salegens TaxID=1737568 RepID=A0A6I4SX10_9SPHN|nr:TonB-dependent receptor [Croceibacterium salegens]MXO59978.1 TonB-dependent receptor [Croceibacterium salegens]